MAKAARLTGWSPVMTSPVASTWMRSETEMCPKCIANGFTQKVSGRSGSRAVMWPATPLRTRIGRTVGSRRPGAACGRGARSPGRRRCRNRVGWGAVRTWGLPPGILTPPAYEEAGQRGRAAAPALGWSVAHWSDGFGRRAGAGPPGARHGPAGPAAGEAGAGPLDRPPGVVRALASRDRAPALLPDHAGPGPRPGRDALLLGRTGHRGDAAGRRSPGHPGVGGVPELRPLRRPHARVLHPRRAVAVREEPAQGGPDH